MSGFQARALPYEPFAELFGLDDEQLAAVDARRYVANEKPGFPCRVSLQDAEVGEEVILTHYQHLPGPSPYAAAGPIFVRQSAFVADPAINEIPEFLIGRLLSLRAYADEGLMEGAEVVEGRELRPALERMFENAAVRQIHVHFARPGCYACRFERA